MPTQQKAAKRSATLIQFEQKMFLFKFSIFGSSFATTWFVFANQL
jgi:hypothetical protein